MSNTLYHIDAVKITCFKCSKEFDYIDERLALEVIDYGSYDKEHWQIACRDCAQKMGDYTMHYCWCCRAQFWSAGRYPETCSPECGDVIDGLAEKAHQNELDREQAWLESYGDEPDSDWTDEDRAESRIKC